MSDAVTGAIRLQVDVPLEPAEALEAVIDELQAALARVGVDFDAQSGVRSAGAEVATVSARVPGRRIVLEWRPMSWDDDVVADVEISADALQNGARVTVALTRWMDALGSGIDLAAWFAANVAAPMLQGAVPESLGDWLTDRRARRPSGEESRAIYRDPLYHYPGFRALLDELALTAEDYLLEVGCGGGALLRDALNSGCRAAGVDHSPDMVRVALEENADAVRAGRLEIRQADAAKLPFDDDTFTCAVMTGVLGFLPDPVVALAEIRRVLAAGGRVVVTGSDPELRGTPGAPEPMASRLRFYESEELKALGRAAGFDEVRVLELNLEAFARDVGIPEEHVPLFAGKSRFLAARKTESRRAAAARSATANPTTGGH